MHKEFVVWRAKPRVQRHLCMYSRLAQRYSCEEEEVVVEVAVEVEERALTT